ncbi:MAG: formylglycine-generating enzyme family protein [Planctomycetota bacterium]|nr:formylglycine-generating enzyme family protein [Planctomycetota bacterium]
MHALAILGLVGFAPVSAQNPPTAPPGLVPVPGGTTRVGISMPALERMLSEQPETRPFAGALVGGTPAHDVAVEPFWIQPTEVTCEQYATYLLATGERAPEPWCESAIRAASEEHARVQAARSEEAARHGLTPPTPETFDPHVWWLEHGHGAGFELSPADRARPVVAVSWDEARAYARWAGLRLATEAEHARAARGDFERTWAWGEDARPERYAATSEVANDGAPRLVASFPEGGGRFGVFDLAGNVWEWTSDAYVAFPGYAPREWSFGSGAARIRVTAIAAFDPAQRVAVGGSFQMPLTLCRTGVRRGLLRDQRAAAVGFRCAADARPGLDMARTLNEDELAPEQRPKGAAPLARCDPRRTLAIDGWRTLPPEPLEGWTPPSGYAVIAAYECVAFAPVEVVPVRDPQTLDRDSLEIAPIVIGYLHTTLPLAEPELTPGTYIVAWRPKGLRKLGGEGARPEGAPLEEVLRIDIEKSHAIVFDLDGRPVTAIPATMTWSVEREGRAWFVDAPETGAVGSNRRRVRFEAYAPSATSKRGPVLTLDLTVLMPREDVAWR